MPKSPTEAIQPSQESATTPQQVVADQPTTEKTTDIRGIAQFLDIPDSVLDRIAPKPAEKEPESEPVTEPVTSEATEEPEALTEPTGELDEEEPEGEEQPEKEPVEGEQPQKIDKRQKRINRLTRQKSELQTQLDNLAAENQKLRTQNGSKPEDQPAPLVGGRLPAIQQEIAKCDAILAWCDDNAEGGEFGEGDKATFYDAKAIKGWRRNAETARQKHVVEEGKETDRLAQARAQADQQAYLAWPEMFDKSTPEYQEAVGYIQRYPFLVNIPEANVALGLLLEGAKSLKARSQKNGQANGEKKHKDIDERAFSTPRVPIAPHSAGPPSRESKPSSQKKFNEAMSNLVKDQDNNDKWLAEAFAAIEEQNRSATTGRTPVKT